MRAPTENGENMSDSEGRGGLLSRIGARMGGRKQTTSSSLDMAEAMRLLQNYEESRQGWFWTTDSSGCLTYVTDLVAEILGKERGDLIGTSFVELFAADTDAERNRSLAFILKKRSKFDGINLRAAIAGDERWWAISGRPQYDDAGHFTGFRGNGVDVTAQRRLEKDSSQLAMYDTLTGLPNRVRMAKILDAATATALQHQGSVAIMMIDLDRFKQVNDTLGHPAGDALLKQVGARLKQLIGERGDVGRLGGDEFQVILPHQDDRGVLGSLASEIIAQLSHPYPVDGDRCVIGATVGIAILPYDGQTSDDLTRGADLALYAAKADGRGRFRFYSSDLHESAQDRRRLEDDLRDALSRGELSLFYQPIVNAQTNTVTGFEALMRWNHPERGPIPPSLFIPIAEEANLIIALGEWALMQACADAATWDSSLRIAVNVSPIQFAQKSLPKVVLRALAQSGLSADRLELEITESVFLGDNAQTEAMFASLKKLGVRLALDDFGTGYSSLSYLQSAPFDKIKIDQSFVRGATVKGSRNAAIIAAIVALADALDMETTAEGLESLDQLELIRKLKVSHIQGYIYSAAISHEDILQRFEQCDFVLVPSGPAMQRNDRQAMYRKVGAIHDDHRYPVMIRNLSPSGALIEGLLDVPLGTQFVIDFGDGQLALATVKRSEKSRQGIAFADTLVNDGNGGLCTRHRISPYILAAAGMPVSALPAGQYAPPPPTDRPASLPAFALADEWKSSVEAKSFVPREPYASKSHGKYVESTDVARKSSRSRAA